MVISFSLLLNVLLVGIIIGGYSKPQLDRGHKSVQTEKRFNEILQVLPPEKSNEFEQRILALKALQHSDRASMKSARKHIMQVFMQEPFDRIAYEEAVKRLNALHQQQMAARVNLMADMAHYLSPAERRQLSRLIMNRKGRK